ncbi:hypothetical protein ABW20_dc0107046 [Dactylellina cionopaga]|nr:hypothetical protein ABW20_dc0107046 [Dactylellina cionopaga]
MFTGVAFCHSTQKALHDIEVVTSWAGNGIAPKVPTEIRYSPDREPFWGAEASVASERRNASNSAVIYNRFKLLLDAGSSRSVYKNAGAYNTSHEDDYIKLPPGKSPVNVCTDYLRLLYKDLMMKVLRKRLPETLDLTPIQFIFTVPAIWDHKAQEATRHAARQAGFCSRPLDTLSLVSEPEAAAMFVLKAMHDSNFSRTPNQTAPSMKAGETFIICDAGGGTVDLISYEIGETQPNLRLREAIAGTGGKCGSSYIDEAFLKFLHEKIGPSFANESIWSKKDIGRGSSLMKTFDSIKKSFGQTTNDVWFVELPVSVEDNEEAGIMDNELELTADDVKNLFDPVVANVIALVKEQVDAIRSDTQTQAVSTIFLVGGFGESQYLYQSLNSWAAKQQPPLTVINPTKS